MVQRGGCWTYDTALREVNKVLGVERVSARHAQKKSGVHGKQAAQLGQQHLDSLREHNGKLLLLLPLPLG